jgi:spore coat polysaccharide biosynthesis protein SpsF
MEALSLVPAEFRVLASPEDSESAFAPLAEAASFSLFTGSKNNVLDRYCQAIRHYSLDEDPSCRIIRATGDNPFVFPDAADAINDEAAMLGADYAAYAGLPYGAGVESVSARALLQAGSLAETPFQREHVCPCLYENPAAFALHRPLAPPKWKAPYVRLTVDTAADYEKAKLLYAELARSVLPEERGRGEAIISVYRRVFEATGTARL